MLKKNNKAKVATLSNTTTTDTENTPILAIDTLSSWINTPLNELALRASIVGYAGASDSYKPITWADISEKVSANMALIQQQASELPTVAIQQTNADELLAALIAVWRSGKVAVLSSAKTFPSPVRPFSPANNTGAVNELFGEIELPNDTEAPQLDADLNQTALVIFTSGSSGTPTGIVKSFAQLDAEVALLEQHWGAKLNSSVFVSMVSRHHMFGLPFGLLWPVLRGNAVFTETVDYSESLETLANTFSISLIASPVQLDKMPASLSWQTLKQRTQIIFSAGAPLPEQAAQRCEERGLTGTEIYGSTETGAVAWRQQLTTPLWQCLSGIQVDIDSKAQTLKISSPCLPHSSTRATKPWFISADKARLTGSEQFELLGRADRICKIGAKRISLNQIEHGLESHPWVKQARCLLLEQKHSRIGAVLVLNADGKAALVDQGRLAIKQQLSKHLRNDIDAVALPRYWRYLSAIPVDAQGKHATSLLNSLFTPEQQPRLPELLEQTQTADNTIELRLGIQHNLAYFNGHFPGNPVLPGVVQIAWVQHYTKQFFEQLSNGAISTAPVVSRLEVLKFQHIIQPANPVTLRLVWQADKSKLQLSYRSGETNYSSGRVVYKNTQAEA